MSRERQVVGVRVRTRWAAVVALLAVVGGTTGCTSSGDEEASSGLTYLGDEVVEVESTLSESDALWRSTWQKWDQVITVPDDSRCWFLADDAGEVVPHGLCGPFRGLGTRAPDWVLLSFVPTSVGTGEVRMAPSAIMPYDPEAGYNFKRLVGVDGEEGDRDVAVPEPEGWPKRMSPGQSEAHPRLQFGRETVARTKVRLLGHDLTFRIITSQRVQFNDRSIYLPPRGGAFVDFRFRPFDSDDAAGVGEALRQAAEAGTLRVRIDHEDRRSIRGALRIPESRGSGLRLKTFGPSALFVVSTLEGARFVISDGDREYVATQDGEVTRSDQDQQ